MFRDFRILELYAHWQIEYRYRESPLMFQKNFILMTKKSGQEEKRTDHLCSTSSLVRPLLNLKTILTFIYRGC